MIGSDSALIPVQPSDTVDDVVARVRSSGARRVELLVPDDAGNLREPQAMTTLRQLLQPDGITVSVISSDSAVLDAARAASLETLSVEGTHVAGPLVSSTSKARLAPAPEGDTMAFLMSMLNAEPGRAAQPPRVTTPLSESPPAPRGRNTIRPEDAEFLDRLDRGDTGSYSTLSPSDSDIYDAFDTLAQQPARQPESERRRDARQPVETQPLPARESRRRRDTARQRVAARSAQLGGTEVAGRRRREALDDDETLAPRRTSSGLLTAFIAALVVVGVVVIGALWLLSMRVSVTVYAPEARVREVPITDEAIPLNAAPTANNAVVQAAPVTAEAEYTVTDQVANQAVSPAGRAHGTLTIVNTIEQALTLPDGTEFIGVNAQGGEARFVIDAAQTVPGATTTASATGRTTTYGQAQVAITARSPGATSNVPENGIKQILLPGQNLLACNSSNFICQNPPIEGGSDEPQWIVTQADFERVLGDALTGLYNAGILSLRAQTEASSTVIDPTTINPDDKALGQPENYEPPIVDPPIGSPANQDTRQFSVTVRTRFNALAVPKNRLIQQQLATVAPAYFEQRTPALCTSNEVPAPRIDQTTWDGVSLKISGAMICTPRGGIPPEVRLQVRDALRGKSRAEAEAALTDLQQQGLIGKYELPEQVVQMPPFDPLLDVTFVDAPPAGQ